MTRFTTTMLALAMLLALAAPTPAAGFSLEKVRADLEATDDSGASGRFRLAVAGVADSPREFLKVVARGLDDDVTYEVRLGDDLESSSSLGEMTVRRSGRGVIRWKSGRDEYPDDVETLAEFGGGKVMVVVDDEVVLEGDIPEFASLGDTPAEGAAAFGAGSEALAATDDAPDDAGGRITASALATSRGTHQILWISAWFLDPDVDYSVAVVDREKNETALGSLDPRGRFGLASLLLDTFRDERMPADVWTLAGQTVEVRDGDGVPVLTGTFPDLR